MQPNEHCLPADPRAWLLNPDSEKETEKWSRHIEHCVQCRSRMEEQPTALAWPKILSEDAWDHELSSSPEVVVKPKPQGGIDQASLVKFARQVIEKSDNPAMLSRLGEFEILEPIRRWFHCRNSSSHFFPSIRSDWAYAEEKLKSVQSKLERLAELSDRMNKQDLEKVAKLLQGTLSPSQDNSEDDPFK